MIAARSAMTGRGASERALRARTGAPSTDGQRRGWAAPLARFLGTQWEDVPAEAEGAARGADRVPLLALNAAAALCGVALAANASRADAPWAVALLYACIGLAFLPAAARILSPAATRGERLALLLVVTAFLFGVRVIRAPVAFIDHDEFLHWATAADILETGRLFRPNPLLPVSPLYPGLELVTAALVQLTGLSLFASALVVLAAARLACVAALYLFFERITGLPRTAAAACLVFMGSSTFVFFDTHFAYESLAVPLLAVALLAGAAPGRGEGEAWRLLLVVGLPALAALAVTHHMTSFFAAGLFGACALAELVRAGAAIRDRLRAVLALALALALPLAWSSLMGNPSSGYLGPVLQGGLEEVAQLVTRAGGRELFVSEDGTVAPAWQRLLAVAGVGLVCLGLLTGFLRTLVLAGLPLAPLRLRSLRGWRSGPLLVLALLTVAYPLSILFRLTRSGWEIGNRIGPFSFFGVSVVVAVAAVGYWQGRGERARSRARTLALALAATVILVGGVISSEGPRILVPAHHQVSADSASVEPMGIAAAAWTQAWLGPDNLFASDRINRLLLATYGRQRVATTLQDWRDTSLALLAPRLGAAEVAVLRDVGVEYVLVDLRLTTALPAVGVYFDGGVADRSHQAPPLPAALLKFNAEPSADRLFDNGYLVMFDVRRLGHAR